MLSGLLFPEAANPYNQDFNKQYAFLLTVKQFLLVFRLKEWFREHISDTGLDSQKA